jgi:hypothetical protein
MQLQSILDKGRPRKDRQRQPKWQKAKIMQRGVINVVWVPNHRPKMIRGPQSVHSRNGYHRVVDWPTNHVDGGSPIIAAAKDVELLPEFVDEVPIENWDEPEADEDVE